LNIKTLACKTRNVLTVHIPLNAQRYPSGQAYMDFYLRAENAFEHIPGVNTVGMTNSLPPDGDSWHEGMRYSDIVVAGKPHTPSGTGGSVVFRAVTPGYFRVLQIPILEGPGFTEADRQSTGHPVILSRLLASRLFPEGNAIGQHIQRAIFNPYLTLDGAGLHHCRHRSQCGKMLVSRVRTIRKFYTLKNKPTRWLGRPSRIPLETAFPASVIGPWIRTQIAHLEPQRSGRDRDPQPGR